MKVTAIVQARMGSTRLPGKVMKLINGMPVIELLLKRLSTSKEIDQIIVVCLLLFWEHYAMYLLQLVAKLNKDHKVFSSFTSSRFQQL